MLVSHWVGLVLTCVSLCGTACFLLHDARQKGAGGVRKFGPLLVCCLSAPFLILNQAVNLLEDSGHLHDTEQLDHMVMAAAWIGSVGVGVAVLWNANVAARFAAAMRGEEWQGCADN